jgi:hypothetical protein
VRAAGLGVAALLLATGVPATGVAAPSPSRAPGVVATSQLDTLVAGGFGHGQALTLRAVPTALTYLNGHLFVGEGAATSGGTGFVRDITLSSGATSIVVGGGSEGVGTLGQVSTEGDPATGFSLARPTGLATDSSGRLVIATDSGTLLRVNAGGGLTAVIGRWASSTILSFGGCRPCIGQVGGSPNLSSHAVTFDTDGSTLVGGSSLVRVATNGAGTTLAGNGSDSDALGYREGIPARAAGGGGILAVASDGTGGVFFGQGAGYTGALSSVRHISAAGTISTVATDAANPVLDPALDPATRITGFGAVTGLSRTATGYHLLISTTTGVWDRAPGGAITRVLGGGSAGITDGASASNVAANAVAVAADGSDGFYFATSTQVWHVNGSSLLQRVEGTGASYSGDGGQALDATFIAPTSITRETDGTLYIGDIGAHVIRAIAPGGVISTFAGTGSAVASGDGGAATSAGLAGPSALQLGPDGSVFFIDGNAVRKIAPGGTITTVAGNGATTPDLTGPVTATSTSVAPSGLAVGSDGVIYIAEYTRNRVRRVASGQITTYVSRTPSGSVLAPGRVAVSGSTLFVTDYTTNALIRVPSAGSPVATAVPSAAVHGAAKLLFDSAGHIYLGNNRYDSDGSWRQFTGVYCDCGLVTRPDHLTARTSLETVIAPTDYTSDGGDGLYGVDRYGTVQHLAATADDPVPVRPGFFQPVVPGPGALTVSWDPVSVPGVPVTSYTLTAQPGGASVTVPGARNSATVTGLTNGTTYSLSVSADNAAGTSFASRTVMGTPRAASTNPSAPINVTASLLANGTQAHVIWDPPASIGSDPLIRYVVHPSVGADTTVFAGYCPINCTSKDVPATPGVPTTYSVSAVNAAGTGPATTSNAVTTTTALNPATNVRVIAHQRTSTIVWDSPAATSGHPLLTACVLTDDDFGTCAAAGNAVNMPASALAASGTDRIRVGLASDVATSRSAAVTATASTSAPPAAPAAPTNVTTSALWQGTVTAHWTPPAGGSPAQDYVVTLLPLGRTLVIPAAAQQAQFTGVPLGSSYSVQVTSDGDGGLGGSAASATASIPAAPGAGFVPLVQTRVYSAANGLLGSSADQTVTLPQIPAGATAVALNAEIESPTNDGYLRLGGPGTATQEFKAGQTISNAATVAVGPGKTIKLHLSAGLASVFLDLAGYYTTTSPADGFVSVPQARVFSTDNDISATPVRTGLASGQDRDVQITGVPTGVTSVVLNAEVKAPTKSGYLRVTPGGTTSTTAVQEFTPGQTISNQVTVKLGANNTVRLHLSAGTATVYLDIAGYFTHSAAADGFVPLQQVRIFRQPVAAGADKDFVLPASLQGADAVLLNAETEAGSAAGYLRITPGGTSSSTAVQEFQPGRAISNQVTVKSGAGHSVRLHLSAGSAVVSLDVMGYYRH